MPKGYWIVRVDITDQEKYKAYIAANAQPLAKFGARFLVRAGRFENPEGTSRARNAVIEFPTYQAALDCWKSPEYQQAHQASGACIDRRSHHHRGLRRTAAGLTAGEPVGDRCLNFRAIHSVLARNPSVEQAARHRRSPRTIATITTRCARCHSYHSPLCCNRRMQLRSQCYRKCR